MLAGADKVDQRGAGSAEDGAFLLTPVGTAGGIAYETQLPRCSAALETAADARHAPRMTVDEQARINAPFLAFEFNATRPSGRAFPQDTRTSYSARLSISHLQGPEFRFMVGEDAQFHKALPPAGDCTSMIRAGSNALFSILPLQFT